jgi:hypothetical protein
MSDGIPVSQLPMRTPTAHVQRLLTPRTVLLVHITYSGLGGVPGFIGVSGSRERGQVKHASALHSA